MDTARNAATTAENKPVYNVEFASKSQRVKREQRLTKINIPSASACQPSVMILSSSLVTPKYIWSRRHDPSTRLEQPHVSLLVCDGCEGGS